MYGGDVSQEVYMIVAVVDPNGLNANWSIRFSDALGFLDGAENNKRYNFKASLYLWC